MSERRLDFIEFENLAVQLLRDGHHVRFQVHGASMRPFIFDGDFVEIQTVMVDELRPGQVVLCRLSSGRLVVHRILSIADGRVLIQGDALLYPDGRVDSSAVLGRVTVIEHGSKKNNLDTIPNWLIIRLWLILVPLRARFFRTIRFGRVVLHAVRLVRR